MVSLADPDRERVGVEPGAAAVVAGLGELVLPEEDPDVLLVALLLEALEEGEDADVAPLPAVEQLAAVGRLELVPRLVGIGAERPGEVEQDPAARLVARLGPGIDRAVGQALLRVGDDRATRRTRAPRRSRCSGRRRRAGLLKEKSAGVTIAAGVSQRLQAGSAVNRSRPAEPSPSSTIAMPSPSWNAVATASAIRPADAGLGRQPVDHDQQLARPG